MNTMQVNSKDVGSFDEVMDALYGKPGTTQREAFRREAYAYCVGTMIRNERRRKCITQQELAEMVGSTKSYISRIETGSVEPSAGLFLSIINALGFIIVSQIQ